jgi:hypothetical protein
MFYNYCSNMYYLNLVDKFKELLKWMFIVSVKSTFAVQHGRLNYAFVDLLCSYLYQTIITVLHCRTPLLLTRVFICSFSCRIFFSYLQRTYNVICKLLFLQYLLYKL